MKRTIDITIGGCTETVYFNDIGEAPSVGIDFNDDFNDDFA